jgi:hypothetical protein
MPTRKLSNDVHLRPVIELSPGDLGGYDLPAAGHPPEKALDAHWRRCLEQAGFTDVRPAAPGTWLVLTDDIVSPRAMRHLLRAHLGPAAYVGREDAAPSLSALQGGFVLFEGEEPLIVPGCCGDLHNLKEWERAAAYRGPRKLVLKVGHPAVSVRYAEGDLWLSEEPDMEHDVAFSGEPTTLRVSGDAFAAAVLRARADVEAFSNRLSSVLREMRRKPERLAMASAIDVLLRRRAVTA